MRRRASFFIGAIVGWIACLLSGVLLNGCSGPDVGKLFGGTCHFRSGKASIELHDPEGVYPPLYGETFINGDTASRCEQGARLTDGSELILSCYGDPVSECDAIGICLDAASGDYFECEGKAVFE